MSVFVVDNLTVLPGDTATIATDFLNAREDSNRLYSSLECILNDDADTDGLKVTHRKFILRLSLC
jgi:hypothetical protein